MATKASLIGKVDIDRLSRLSKGILMSITNMERSAGHDLTKNLPVRDQMQDKILCEESNTNNWGYPRYPEARRLPSFHLEKIPVK